MFHSRYAHCKLLANFYRILSAIAVLNVEPHIDVLCFQLIAFFYSKYQQYGRLIFLVIMCKYINLTYTTSEPGLMRINIQVAFKYMPHNIGHSHIVYLSICLSEGQKIRTEITQNAHALFCLLWMHISNIIFHWVDHLLLKTCVYWLQLLIREMKVFSCLQQYIPLIIYVKHEALYLTLAFNTRTRPEFTAYCPVRWMLQEGIHIDLQLKSSLRVYILGLPASWIVHVSSVLHSIVCRSSKEAFLWAWSFHLGCSAKQTPPGMIFHG